MEHESPDWERAPSVEIETKDEPLEPPQIKAKTETSSTKDIKFEDAKKEELTFPFNTPMSSGQQPT